MHCGEKEAEATGKGKLETAEWPWILLHSGFSEFWTPFVRLPLTLFSAA